MEVITVSQNLQSVLEAARQLPPEQRRLLAEQILTEAKPTDPPVVQEARRQRALSVVDETFGAIKGLDRAALIRLAEDEEFCGY